MITRVVMPKLTDTMEQGVLVEWKKQEGDAVVAGDVLAEIETDKAVMDLESFGSGTLRRILVPDGETVDAGALIAVIAEDDEEIESALSKDQKFQKPEPSKAQTPPKTSVKATESSKGRTPEKPQVKTGEGKATPKAPAATTQPEEKPAEQHPARMEKEKPAESPLTTRETEILNLLCDGENYKTIADKLFISGDTVRAHIKNIYRKLQVNSRAEAVKKAIKNRLV